ncbi:MAG: sucrase ferredoxin [Gaiellaceae bacterium]
MSSRPARPFCAEVARAAEEPLEATASRIEHWLLVEHSGYWPYEPLDAAPFAGAVREHLAAQLAALRPARLVLVKRPRGRTEPLRVLYGSTPEQGGRFHQRELEGHADLLELDLASELLGRGEPAGAPVDDPLLLVCTHGTRDRCCARYGQALYNEVARQADPEWVWQASHVGGDRFAGNLVVLPEGLYFGRVGPDDVPAVLASYAAGNVELPLYRGRSCHSFAVQAAEGHVRRATGLAGIDDLRLAGTRRTGPHAFTVELLVEQAGVLHSVRVERELGEPTLLTCDSTELARPRRYRVRSHGERPA